MQFQSFLPIGAEEDFKGVVDLIKIEQSFGTKQDKVQLFEVVPIPDMIGRSLEYRENLVEAVADCL